MYEKGGTAWESAVSDVMVRLLVEAFRIGIGLSSRHKFLFIASFHKHREILNVKATIGANVFFTRDPEIKNKSPPCAGENSRDHFDPSASTQSAPGAKSNLIIRGAKNTSHLDFIDRRHQQMLTRSDFRTVERM